MENIYNPLSSQYKAVENRIAKLPLDRLGIPAYVYPFALYNSDIVCMRVNGELRCRSKADFGERFIANTAIPWENGYLAIWDVGKSSVDEDGLASKLLHEMYHAHQYQVGDTRFADEFNAVFNYRYVPDCFNLKSRENELLLSLSAAYDETLFDTLCCCRSRRKREFAYEYDYEARVETIEGCAQYLELSALRILAPQKYEKAFTALKERVANKRNMLSVRALCYDTGALLLMAMELAGYSITQIAQSTLTISDALLQRDFKRHAALTAEYGIEALLCKDAERLTEIVQKAILTEPVLDCASSPYTLTGFNVYSARYIVANGNGYLLSQYFIMYNDGNGDTALYGDFAVHTTQDNKAIIAIYRCNIE